MPDLLQRSFERIALGVLCALLLAACNGPRELVSTPTRFVASGYPESEVPAGLRTSVAPLLYVTDRLPEGGFFGAGRSNAMVFGTVDVDLAGGASWDTLVAASGTQDRRRPLRLSVRDFDEIGRFRDTPLPFTLRDGRLVDLAEPKEVYEQAARQFQSLVASRLSASNQRDVVLFVHGFNSSFEGSAKSLAEVWHFTGRWGVPLLYSWPAGRGGLVGYFTDRESGEFTVFHLKETLRLIATTPGVERIHILAHSRGTDVVTTALREMVIATRAAGRNPRDVLKIDNLVLAAPDLDFGVVGQRLIAERFGPAFGQVTIYTNAGDGALGLSMLLMEGQRFGRLQPGGLSMDEERIFENIMNVSFINVPQARGFFGHSYYRDSPGALSDLSAVIRESATPGTRARPLTHLGGNFWQIPD